MLNDLNKLNLSTKRLVSDNASMLQAGQDREHMIVDKSVGLLRVNELLLDSNEKRHILPQAKLVHSSTSGIHILLVTETWQPDVNGVAMSLHQLMSQLVMMGHKVSLLRPEPKHVESNDFKDNSFDKHHRDDPQLNQLHIVTKDIQVKGMPIPKYPDLQMGMPVYNRIKRELKQLKPDIVHIATEGPLGLAALLAAKKQKIAATTGYHTQFHDFSRHFGIGIIARPLLTYFKWFHNASEATCVPSQKTQNDLDKIGFKRLVQVGRGVDLERFNPEHRSETLRQEWGAHKQHTVLIMVSRLSPEKGVDLVIQSFKALQSAQLHRAMKLVIVGDGPDRQRLESLASDSSEDIIFTGAKKGHELAEHYASGDAFIFASQVETFGNVVIEAMASGLPVYAYDDAAAGMLVNPNNGGLVPVGNKKEFINMVAALPKMQVLKEQSSHAVQQVAGFSWQRPAKQMLEMFINAIQAKV